MGRGWAATGCSETQALALEPLIHASPLSTSGVNGMARSDCATTWLAAAKTSLCG